MWLEYLILALLTLMCVILKIKKKSTILNSGGQNWTNLEESKKKLFWIMKYGPPQLYGW